MPLVKSLLDNREIGDYQIGANEPIGKGSINRVISHLLENDSILRNAMSELGLTGSVQMWSQNAKYSAGDVVIYVDSGSNVAFILCCISNSPQPPEYVISGGIPDFSSSGWDLIHKSMFYLHNDASLSENILTPAVVDGLGKHVSSSDFHGDVPIYQIEDFWNRFLKKDLSNYKSSKNLRVDGSKTGGYGKSINSIGEQDGSNFIRVGSDNVLEMELVFAFDERANQNLVIENSRYVLNRNPVKDKSDDNIFSSYYLEDTQMVLLSTGATFSNMRIPGTNVFSKVIEFPRPFASKEYMVFQSSYMNGQFAFASSAGELSNMTSGTTDCFVGQILFTNKTASSITAVLPIHTHFAEYGKYSIGVPFINKFRIHLVGKAI